MKIGVLGGTFNPPHNGHLAAAAHVRDALGLDCVLFIPTNLPPHKQMPEDSATTQQRCEMVRLMVQSHDWAVFSDLEIQRGGTSYTVDTLRALRAQGYDEMTLLVGTDMLLSFDTGWRQPDEIARLATIAVVARAQDDWPALRQKAEQITRRLGAKIVLVDCPVMTISSTEVRNHGCFDQTTPPQVARYIQKNRLYQKVSQ